MRALLAGSWVLVMAGCGLSLSIDETAPAPAPSASVTSKPPPTPPPTSPPGGDAAVDAEPSGDGGGPDAELVDASDGAVVVPPDPAKVSVSYAAGKNRIVYAFDVTTATFTAQTSTGCPSAEETAVMADGTVYVTSSDSRELFTWAAGAGCTRVGGNNLSLPFALGTADLGGVEELVGYRNGDYVKVNRATGAVTMVTPGALGMLRPSGDVTRIGTKGYLAAAGGTGGGAFACPAGGDCIVSVNLTDGRPVARLQHFAGLGIYGIAHSGGMLLLYANDQVFPLDPATLVLGASLAAAPNGANFSGAGAPAFPTP
jgi:hypothetical protein